MEYGAEYDVPGSIPECGAIFMSNVSTKSECFRRKLLGLPFAQANFVKQIKAGMVLFLFEFERRELYGVFRACSDGSMNIVPHAFTSSGKQFPAQVRFTPIWYCNPLSEHEFQDAIEENYFSKKKFNFGLSEDQVRRLLRLFSSKKLQKPQRPFSRQASKSIGKERSLAGDDDYFLRNKAEKFVEEDSLVSGIDAKHPGNYSSNNGRRLDGNRFMMRDVIKNDHNVNSCQGYDILTEPPSGSLGKRRKDDDDRFLMQDSIAYDHYSDHDLAHVIHIDHPGDFSDKSGRVAEENKFSLTNCIMGSNTGPIATPKYFWESLDKVGRATENSRFPTGDNLGDKYTPEHSTRLVTSMDPHENIAIKARRASDDRGFFMDYRVENDSDSENYPEPVISTDRRVNTSGRLRTIDRGMFIGNDRTEIEQYVDNGSCEVRKESDGIFSMSDRVDVPSEYFANRTDYASRLNDHDRFLARTSMENAHNIKSSYPLDKLSRVSDEGILKKTDRLENAYNMQYSSRLQNSPASTNLCQSRKNPSFFSRETKSSFCQDHTKLRSAFPPSMEWKNCDSSSSTSHDAIMVTGTVPYDPELPGIHHRNQSSFTVDCASRSALDFHLHHNSNGSPFSASFNRPSPHRSEAEYLSKHLDISSGFGNKVPLPTTSPNSYTLSGLQTSSSLLSDEYHGKMEAKATGQELYKGLLFPESTSASPPYSRNDMCERQNASPFIEFDKHALTLQGRYEHKNPHHENSQGFRVDDACFSSDKGHLHSESSHEKSNNRDIEYTYQNAKGTPTDSKSKRTSVFARLSSASEVHVQENDHDNFFSAEEEINYDLQFDECDLGASVDQVMNTLYESLDSRIMKARKSSVRNHRMECDEMKMPPLKMKNVAEHVIEENCDEIAEETRVVSFKRRSETKKNKDGAKERISVDTLEHEREGSVQKSVREGLEGKQHRRRKLTRPVFGKKEHLNEGLSSDGHSNLQLLSSQGSSKDGTGNLDDSVKSRDNEKCSSPNSMLVHLASLSGHEGNSANIEQSSYCGGKNSVNRDRKESFDGGIKRASNLQVSSHEGFNAKENTGSCDGLARSHESENISQDVGFVHVINPTICEAGNTNSDSSYCKERNDVTCGTPLRRDGEKMGEQLYLEME